MKLKLRLIIFTILLIHVCGCSTPSVSPVPTSPPKWITYEAALAKAVVNTEDALCEWEIWGVSDGEVYVWAYCKVKGPIGSAGSVPAVIYMEENGQILEIRIPGDGVSYPIDVRKLFPLDVQSKIFNHEFDSTSAIEHITKRMTTNGPPLIVISGTPLP